VADDTLECGDMSPLFGSDCGAEDDSKKSCGGVQLICLRVLYLRRELDHLHGNGARGKVRLGPGRDPTIVAPAFMPGSERDWNLTPGGVKQLRRLVYGGSTPAGVGTEGDAVTPR
jgi:hypothetical protein